MELTYATRVERMSGAGSKVSIIGIASALAAGCAYGVGGTLSQIVKAQGFELNHIVVAQFLAAVVILGIAVLVRYRPAMCVGDAVKLMIVGAMSVSSSYFYYYAIDLLTVGSAVAIQFQYVWIVVLISSVVERRKPSAWVVLAAVLVIAGSILASGVADEMLGGGLVLDPVGLLCAVGCAVMYGLFIFFNGKVATEHPPITRTFFMVLAGFIMASVIAPDFYLGACDIVAIIPGGVAMGLVMSVIPCVCLAVAAVRLPGGIVAILTSLELPMAVLSGIVALGETVTPLVLAGVVVILLAIVLSELPSLMANGRDSSGLESSGDGSADSGQVQGLSRM